MLKIMEQTNEKINKKLTQKLKTTTSKPKESKKNTPKIGTKKTTKVPRKSSTKSTADINVVSSETSKDLKEILKINPQAKPVEYYDLPYRYNETTIKILAQTPHSIFMYWDISDNDRANLEKTYGKDFFYNTKPVLIVHNQTQNYTFEIEVDDFTNSWYLRTPTSNCIFNIELARKKISSCNNIEFYTNDDRLHITSSNTIQSPNDHALTNSLKGEILFKNIKTNQLEEIKVADLQKVKKLYKDFYFENDFIVHNPSSNIGI